jgi:hypothetical protein
MRDKMKAKTEFNSGWLFPEDVKGTVLAEFVECKDEVSKNGKTYPVMYFLGKSENLTGDLKISGYKVAFDQQIIDEFGEDTDKWKTAFLCSISVKNNKFFVQKQ